MHTIDGHWTTKLGLGTHQVIWYQEKHVLIVYNSIPVFLMILC